MTTSEATSPAKTSSWPSGDDIPVGSVEVNTPARYRARALVPLLGETMGGLWSPHEAHVDNRALGSEFGRDYVEMFGQKLAMEAIRTVNRLDWKKEEPLAVTAEQVRAEAVEALSAYP